MTRRVQRPGRSGAAADAGSVLRRGWNYEALLAANPTMLDVKFRQADQFQAPREIRFLVKFEF